MTALAWVALGLMVVWVASLLMGSGRYGLIGDLPVGIIGGAVGAWGGSRLLGIDVTGINPGSVVVSLVGAAAAICCLRALAPSRPWWQAWRDR